MANRKAASNPQVVQSSTDNTVARFDGTGGVIQGTGVVISDGDVLTVPSNGSVMGDEAVAAAAAGAAIRPFNLVGTQATMRIWRSSSDAAVEFVTGAYAAAASSAGGYWDIFQKASTDQLIFRRRTGGVFQEKLALSADGSVTFEANAALINARVRPRVGTTTSSATPAINTDTADVYTITALAANITGFTMTGTPTDGQKLWIAITGTAARTITWGSSFEASTVALPTTTVSTNRLDCEFIWNAATSKWRIVRAV